MEKPKEKKKRRGKKSYIGAVSVSGGLVTSNTHVLGPCVNITPWAGRPQFSEAVPEAHCTARVVAAASVPMTEPTKGNLSPKKSTWTVGRGREEVEEAEEAKARGVARRTARSSMMQSGCFCLFIFFNNKNEES